MNKILIFTIIFYLSTYEMKIKSWKEIKLNVFPNYEKKLKNLKKISRAYNNEINKIQLKKTNDLEKIVYFNDIISIVIKVIIVLLVIIFLQQYLKNNYSYKIFDKKIEKKLNLFKSIINNKDDKIYKSYNDNKENIVFFDNPVYHSKEERKLNIIEKAQNKLDNINNKIDLEKEKVEKLKGKNKKIHDILKKFTGRLKNIIVENDELVMSIFENKESKVDEIELSKN